MGDITLVETGNGGDIQLKGNDLDTSATIFNQIYMGLFGGNPEASTTGEELETQQRGDWWGNGLLFPDQPGDQQNSRLEKVLTEVALNSSGRIKIEETIKKDLKFLEEIAEITVETSIIGVDKIEITIFAQEPGNLQKQEFIFIWDATKAELIVNEVI